jgi:hypothetical protein
MSLALFCAARRGQIDSRLEMPVFRWERRSHRWNGVLKDQAGLSAAHRRPGAVQADSLVADRKTPSRCWGCANRATDLLHELQSMG